MSLTVPDLTFDVKDFSAGFMDSPEASRLPKGATAQAANAFFYSLNAEDASTVMGKRPGARLVNPSCISAGKRVDALYEFRREGVTLGQLLAVCDGGLYLWDGGSSFTLVAAGAFLVGGMLEGTTYRNLAFLMDGTNQKMFDGTTLYPIGFAAPTAPPALAAVAPSGAGLTGTYQSLAVWYDSVRDHESSPTTYSTAVALTAQDRQHTKPTGAPPANVDAWRVYVRRTDTNEIYFKLVATVAIGTATAQEAMADSTRNLATTLLAPLPNQNDVPPAFAFMTNAQGYGFGVKRDDSFVYVSAPGDLQSWHPKDKIPVARGDGQNVTSIKKVGTDIIVQKARRSYKLTGDRMPFLPDELSDAYGNHSQASAVEAAGTYWCWDDEKGPYVTDLGSTWKSLVDGRISTLLSQINTAAEIRCCHYKRASLVCWIVATGSSTRTRTMLPYNYLIGAWLPPVTGIEYGSLTTFQLATGIVNVYVGDQWGRVYQYFVDNLEGVPSGTTLARVVSATTSAITCDFERTLKADGSFTTAATACAFYTTGDGLKGMPVAVIDASGAWTWRQIQSNTATAITIDSVNGAVFPSAPVAGATVVVGGIDWFWTLPLVDFGLPLVKKRGGFVYAELRASSTAFFLGVRARLNDTSSLYTSGESLRTPTVGAAWGMGLWGSMLWAKGNKRPVKQRIMRSFFGLQFELSNRFPNQPCQVVTFGLTADRLRGQWASGG